MELGITLCAIPICLLIIFVKEDTNKNLYWGILNVVFFVQIAILVIRGIANKGRKVTSTVSNKVQVPVEPNQYIDTKQTQVQITVSKAQSQQRKVQVVKETNSVSTKATTSYTESDIKLRNAAQKLGIATESRSIEQIAKDVLQHTSKVQLDELPEHLSDVQKAKMILLGITE